MQLLHHLGWTDGGAHLVGFSLGGMVALETALLAPSLFASLALISTHAGGVRGTLPPT